MIFIIQFCRTTIGFGSKKQGSPGVHGSPLGDEDIAQLKKKFGLNTEQFYIPQQVYDFYKKLTENGNEKEKQWKQLFAKYKEKYPELAKVWEDEEAGKLPDGWESVLPTYTSKDSPVATR